MTSLFMTPDGDVGSRRELRLRYRSQRLWTDKKKRAWKRLKIVARIDGPADFDWLASHPDYVSRKPKRMRTTTYERLMRRLAEVG